MSLIVAIVSASLAGSFLCSLTDQVLLACGVSTCPATTPCFGAMEKHGLGSQK